MEQLKFDGVVALNKNEMQSIHGGAVFAACCCLFALGMVIGLCIGSLVQRR